MRFAIWLRANHAFPVRVPVYLSPRDHLITLKGEIASATFFAPWEPDVEPYIRIATGDYAKVRAERGRDNALAGYLSALAHEVIHYQQWVETGEMTERGVVAKASGMVERYARTVRHP